MITKAVIVLMLFGLTSSANAMTVIFKDYKAANNDEKAFYLLYLNGVREGIIELNVVLEEKRQQPLFCLPEKSALTVGQAEDIMMSSRKDNRSRSASYWTSSRARFARYVSLQRKALAREMQQKGCCANFV